MADISARIRLRADTSSSWSSVNPILAIGEPGFETDTRRIRIGDGATPFLSLPYYYLSTDFDPAGYMPVAAASYTGNLNSITTTGVFKIGTGATNGPAGMANSDWLLSLHFDANSGIQVVFSRATNLPQSWRVKAAGVWGAWDGAVTMAAAQTISGAKTFTAALVVSATATFNAAVTMTADLTLKGAVTASVDDGTKSSGTYTPTPVGGNFRHATNNGAFTLAAPSAAGTYSMVLDLTNGASAGAITFSGFLRTPTGDPLTTTNGHKFRLYLTKGAAGVTCNVEALQ